jgi:hypothetical protein
MEPMGLQAARRLLSNVYNMETLFIDETRKMGLCYEGKSISKLQMDIELKQIRVVI